ETHGIKVDDNVSRGALVANLVEADALVILTDQEGLYDADPRKVPGAKLIEEHAADDAALEAIAGGTGSALARGGMLTKVQAAKRAARGGAHPVSASGRGEDVLLRIARGERVGTLLRAGTLPIAAKKQWLADHLSPPGSGALGERRREAAG